MTRFKTFTILWLLSFETCSTGLFKLYRLDRNETSHHFALQFYEVYMIRSCSRDVFMGERMSTKDAIIQCYNAIWEQFWGHGPKENLLEIGLSIKLVFHAYVLIAISPYTRQHKSIQMLLVKRQHLTWEDTEEFYWKYNPTQGCKQKCKPCRKLMRLIPFNISRSSKILDFLFVY